MKAKKGKKFMIGICAAAVLAGGTGLYIGYRNKKNSTSDTIYTSETVLKTDIQSSYEASGKIITDSSVISSSSADSSSTKVVSVNVKEGDQVKAGDILYTLDSQTAADSLNTAREKYNLQVQQNNIDAQEKANAATNAERAAAENNASAQLTIQEAQEDLSAAQNELNAKNAALNAAKQEEESARTDYEEAQKTAGQTASSDTTDDALNTAKTRVETAAANRQKAEEDCTAAQNAVTTAERALRKAQSDADQTAREGNNSMQEAQLARETQAVSGQQSLQDSADEIKKAREQIDEASVRADMDGTVTAVNVEAGQPLPSGNAVVINNLSSLKAEVNVDEAHIASIHEGQKVTLTTESTGDKKLAGTVATVARVPLEESTSRNTSGKAQYKVVITITSSADGLLSGMNAKVDFVLAEAKNTIAVPKDAIQSDNGEQYVLVLAEDGKSQEKIPVKTGLSNGSYIQITSENLKEGQTLQVPSASSSADSTLLEGMYDE